MDHNQPGGSGGEFQAGQDRFFEERLNTFQPLEDQGGVPPVPPYPLFTDPYTTMPKKSKLSAGLLAFFIPGTGHFYLGLMQKGLFIMLLLFLDIGAIPYIVNYRNVHNDNSYIPFLVLVIVLIPVIYFYNLFDALQSTDQVNAYRRAVQLGQIQAAPAGSDPLGRQPRGGTLGMALIAVGFFLFLISSKPVWLEDLFSMMGSYVGAVILIGAGLLLFLTESKKR